MMTIYANWEISKEEIESAIRRVIEDTGQAIKSWRLSVECETDSGAYIKKRSPQLNLILANGEEFIVDELQQLRPAPRRETGNNSEGLMPYKRKPFYEQCPTCNGWPKRTRSVNAAGYRTGFRVRCLNEHCATSPQTENYHTWSEARRAWNSKRVSATR